jgi:hypothetical protein
MRGTTPPPARDARGTLRAGAPPPFGLHAPPAIATFADLRRALERWGAGAPRDADAGRLLPGALRVLRATVLDLVAHRAYPEPLAADGALAQELMVVTDAVGDAFAGALTVGQWELLGLLRGMLFDVRAAPDVRPPPAAVETAGDVRRLLDRRARDTIAVFFRRDAMEAVRAGAGAARSADAADRLRRLLRDVEAFYAPLSAAEAAVLAAARAALAPRERGGEGADGPDGKRRRRA